MYKKYKFENNYNNKIKREGDNCGTKDELPIYIFYSSVYNKKWAISKIYFKNAKRRKL